MASPQKRTAPPNKGGTFRVLIGDHIGDGPPGCECEDCIRTGGKDHRYRARRFTPQGEPVDPPGYDNDLIEAPTDLTRMNAGPNSRKFERVHDQRVAQPAAEEIVPDQTRHPARPGNVPEGIETWSRKQLEAFAVEQGIDLADARSRDEMVRAIRGG